MLVTGFTQIKGWTRTLQETSETGGDRAGCSATTQAHGPAKRQEQGGDYRAAFLLREGAQGHR